MVNTKLKIVIVSAFIGSGLIGILFGFILNFIIYNNRIFPDIHSGPRSLSPDQRWFVAVDPGESSMYNKPYLIITIWDTRHYPGLKIRLPPNPFWPAVPYAKFIIPQPHIEASEWAKINWEPNSRSFRFLFKQFENNTVTRNRIFEYDLVSDTISLTAELLPEFTMHERYEPTGVKDLLGVNVATLSPELRKQYGYPGSLRGVAITFMNQCSFLQRSQIGIGDAITEINGEEVTNQDKYHNVMSAINYGETIRVQGVRRDGSEIGERIPWSELCGTSQWSNNQNE